jgi:hypothetical protein
MDISSCVGRRRGWWGIGLVVVVVVASAATGVVAASAGTTPQGTVGVTGGPGVTNNVGTYYPLPPQRILDTRIGVGAPRAPIGPGAALTLQVTGRGGVPASGVSAAVLNVTATNVSAATFITVYPDGGPRPTTSTLNAVKGWTGANSVSVGVGPDGQVDIFNNVGTTDLIADVVGFYAADATVVTMTGPNGGFGVGDEYQPSVTVRVFDSRVAGEPATHGAPVPANRAVQVGVDFDPATDAHVRALVVNVTAVQLNNGEPKGAPGDLVTGGTVARLRPGMATPTQRQSDDAGDQ